MCTLRGGSHTFLPHSIIPSCSETPPPPHLYTDLILSLLFTSSRSNTSISPPPPCSLSSLPRTLPFPSWRWRSSLNGSVVAITFRWLPCAHLNVLFVGAGSLAGSRISTAVSWDATLPGPGHRPLLPRDFVHPSLFCFLFFCENRGPFQWQRRREASTPRSDNTSTTRVTVPNNGQPLLPEYSHSLIGTAA